MREDGGAEPGSIDVISAARRRGAGVRGSSSIGDISHSHKIFVSQTSKLTRGMQGLVRHEILPTSLIIQVPWFLRLGVEMELNQHQLSVLQL